MREVGIIIRREFDERVRTRAFLIGTIAFPVFMAAVMILPSLIGRGGEEKRLALVDETEAGIGVELVRVLGAPAESDDEYRYLIEPVPGTLEENRAALNSRVQAEEIDGYIVLPAEVVDSNRVVYRARNIANTRMLRDVSRAASRAVQAQRLRMAGLQVTEVAELIRPVRLDEAQITDTGEEGRDAESTFWFAYGVAFLIYFMIAIYGTAVMRSVLEEKTNRISEVLVSTVRARDLMLGKILGVSTAALAQVAIWGAIAVLLVTQSDAIAAVAGVSPANLTALRIAPGAAALFAAYFVLGFVLYAAVFAALGAAVTTEQEAQSLQMTVMVPIFLPLLFLIPITNEPLGGIATALGLIPFTSPMAMPMRISVAPLPAAQVVLSLAILVLAVFAVAWLAGKIYRIGILSTGRRASLAELGRWLREA